MALTIVCSFMCATVPLWLFKNPTAHISWFLFQRENKFLTSEAANISFFPRTQRGPGKRCWFSGFSTPWTPSRFLCCDEYWTSEGVPPSLSTSGAEDMGLLQMLSPASAAPHVQGSQSGCRQTQRAAIPGNSTRLVPPSQNNQNSLENLKLRKYVVHFQNFEMKHSFYQPAT